MFSRILATAFALGLLIPGVAAADPEADVAVALDADGTYLVPGAHYNVTVTNTGPAEVSSATVVVRLDPRAASATGTDCPYDPIADTLTCTFSSVDVGAAEFRTMHVYYVPSTPPAEYDATADLIATTPADPNPANDSASAKCWYTGWQPGIPVPIPHPRTYC